MFCIKIVIAIGLVAFLLRSESIRKINWNDLAAPLSRWPLLAAAALLLTGVPLLGGWRWHLLMRCQGFRISFLRTLHMTMVGMLFNCISVGYTGGDVIKACYVGRDQERGRRAEAVYSVGFDRVIGLFGLMVVAVAAMLFNIREVWAVSAMRHTALAMTGALSVLFFGFLFMWSKRFRDSERIAPRLERIPFGSLFLRFYRSVKIYRTKYRVLLAALALSVVAHLVNMGVLWLLGRALGMPEISIPKFIFCIAVGLAVSAVGPPMGLGFGQYAFAAIFKMQWGDEGERFGFLLACLQQLLVAGVNTALGLPAFLSIRRELSTVRAQCEIEVTGCPPPSDASDA
jgi:uncharacterized protein (TIRG00374 family)